MSKKLWMSKKDIAELLGVDITTIDIYINILHSDDNYQTEFEKGKQLYAPAIIQVVTEKRDTKQIDAALKAQKLAILKFQYEVDREKYMEKSIVYEEWAKRFAVMKESLLSLVYKVSKPLSGRELPLSKVKQILMRYIIEMMEDFGKDSKYTLKPKGVDIGDSSKNKRSGRSSKQVKPKGSKNRLQKGNEKTRKAKL